MKFFSCAIIAMVMWSAPVFSETQVTPYQVIEGTTNKVTVIIDEARAYYDDDPDRYYAQIGDVLEAVVNFDSFSRNVMGRYASKKEYQRLATAEEKAAYRQRMDRFSTVFRGALVETYAKGLLAFSGNRIEVLPLEDELPASGSVTVVQHIYGKSEQPYVVLYKMRRNKAGEWKIRNVTIEAVNLGKVYQSQFASGVREYDGDVDKVIDNWVVEEVKATPQPKMDAG